MTFSIFEFPLKQGFQIPCLQISTKAKECKDEKRDNKVKSYAYYKYLSTRKRMQS